MRIYSRFNSLAAGLLLVFLVSPLARTQEVLNNDSVVKMVKGGLAEDTIISMIEHQPGKYDLGVDQMIALRGANVPDKVLQAMLRRSEAAKAPAPAPAQPAAPVAAPVPIVLPDGTAIKIAIKKHLSSASALAGDAVPAEVAADVVVAGVIVAPRGAAATAVVKNASPAKRAKIGGKLDIEIQTVTLLDGSKATLRQRESKSGVAKGAAKTTGTVLNATRSFGLSHGKEKEIAAGALETVYVDGTITLDRQRFVPAAAAAAPASTTPASSASPATPAAPPKAQPAAPAPPPRLSAIVRTRPNRVELTAPGGTVAATHRLLGGVSSSVTDHVHRRAYLLHSNRKAVRISAFDLTTGKELVSTAADLVDSSLALSDGGSSVIVYGYGKVWGRAKTRDEAKFRVLDPLTLEARLTHNFGERADVMRFLAKSDRLMVITPRSQEMFLINPKATKMPEAMDLGGKLIGSVTTTDGLRMICLIRNVDKKGKHLKNGGELRTIEIASGKNLSTSAEFPDAKHLIRLGRGDEYWVTNDESMRRITPDGKPTRTVISFKEQDKELGKGLDGFPGSSLALGDRYAIGILKKNGTLAHKLALVNPEAGTVDSVTPIGRAGVRTGKSGKRWGLAILATAASAAVAGAAASAMPPGTTFYYPVFYPGGPSQVTDMAVATNNKLVFVMDAESDDVTAVRTDGTIAGTLPVKSAGAVLWRPEGGKLIYHFGPSLVTAIDENDAKVAKEIPIEKGFHAVRSSALGEFYLCDKAACDVWDALKGESRSKLDLAQMKERLAAAAGKAAEEEDTEAELDEPDDEPTTEPAENAVKPAEAETAKPAEAPPKPAPPVQ